MVAATSARSAGTIVAAGDEEPTGLVAHDTPDKIEIVRKQLFDSLVTEFSLKP